MSESTNADFAASSPLFRAACSEEGIEPTKRQASKWRRGTGRAFQNLNAHRRDLARQLQQAEAAFYAASTTPTLGEDGISMDGPPDQSAIDYAQNAIKALTRRIDALR